MGLFLHRRNSENGIGLHADATGTGVARVGMATTRRPVLRASAFQPGDGELPDSRIIDEVAHRVSAAGDDLNVVLSTRDYQLLLVEAPRVDADELRSAIRWRVKDLIDFHIDDAVFDVFAVPGQHNRPRGQALMYAVAARAGRIQTLVDCVHDSSLQLQRSGSGSVPSPQPPWPVHTGQQQQSGPPSNTEIDVLHPQLH